MGGKSASRPRRATRRTRRSSGDAATPAADRRNRWGCSRKGCAAYPPESCSLLPLLSYSSRQNRCAGTLAHESRFGPQSVGPGSDAQPPVQPSRPAGSGFFVQMSVAVGRSTRTLMPMPIVDVELVCASEAEFRSVSALAVAQALGKVLGSAPGHAWVRLRFLSNGCYAENDASLSEAKFPVFVTVLHARLPVEPALSAEAYALTQAVAKAVGRPYDRVHVQYAPAGVGRQAFGGRLVE